MYRWSPPSRNRSFASTQNSSTARTSTTKMGSRASAGKSAARTPNFWHRQGSRGRGGSGAPRGGGLEPPPCPHHWHRGILLFDPTFLRAKACSCAFQGTFNSTHGDAFLGSLGALGFQKIPSSPHKKGSNNKTEEVRFLLESSSFRVCGGQCFPRKLVFYVLFEFASMI